MPYPPYHARVGRSDEHTLTGATVRAPPHSAIHHHSGLCLRTTLLYSFGVRRFWKTPLLALCSTLACSSARTGTAAPGDAGVDAARVIESYTVDAGACSATLATVEFLASPHVDVGTQVSYNSNPPSSGPHYAIWAAFREYDKAIDRRFYVHNLEHGATVFLYKCASAAACPELVRALRDVVREMPADPACSGPKNRVMLLPDPLLDTSVAVAAWGATYRADCVDPPSLLAFAKKHYAKSPEDLCADGQPDL
jgi:Protein of unknown function (DUF3105)